MAYLAGFSVDNGTVLVLITIVVLPIAAIAFASSGGAWKQIGKGRFAMEREPSTANRPGPPSRSAERAMQAAEARQMLEAKSYRRVRQGQPALDVEAELRQVLAGDGGLSAGGRSGSEASTSPPEADPELRVSPPEADPELRGEVRRLVMIRNERRVREGKAPLEVEAETERQLADFIGSPY
jgi:hypothetical protein